MIWAKWWQLFGQLYLSSPEYGKMAEISRITGAEGYRVGHCPTSNGRPFSKSRIPRVDGLGESDWKRIAAHFVDSNIEYRFILNVGIVEVSSNSCLEAFVTVRKSNGWDVALVPVLLDLPHGKSKWPSSFVGGFLIHSIPGRTKILSVW